MLLKVCDELKECSVMVNCISCNKSVPFMDIKIHKTQCSFAAITVDTGASSSKASMVYNINVGLYLL